MKNRKRNKPRFTPGPYYAEPEDASGGTWTLRSMIDNTVIATIVARKCERSAVQAEADARFLDKAPQMYRLLKVLHKAPEQLPAKKRAAIGLEMCSVSVMISNIERGEVL